MEYTFRWLILFTLDLRLWNLTLNQYLKEISPILDRYGGRLATKTLEHNTKTH